MGDVKFEKVEVGYIVDPESETKEVFIPSPPTMTTVKINPRPVIILLANPAIGEGYDKVEELKAYAEAKKVFIACPDGTDTDAVEAAYTYIDKKAKTLNVKKNEVSVQYIGDLADVAQEAVDYLVDELDADIDDAEEFEF